MSTAIFILASGFYIKLQEKIEQVESPSQTIRKTMITQFEYVLTIIANQGLLKEQFQQNYL